MPKRGGHGSVGLGETELSGVKLGRGVSGAVRVVGSVSREELEEWGEVVAAVVQGSDVVLVVVLLLSVV